MKLPHIAQCAPTAVQVEAGKTYAWCTCGLSSKQPFCDGTHKTIDPADGVFKSLKITFEEAEEVWFCNCKHTRNAPFCDGTHKQLNP